MNWSIKDENMKNRLWTERCQKDLAACERHTRDSRVAWNVQPATLERHIVSRDVNDRSRRFLDSGPSLLASLSRYVRDSNVTPEAQYVRSFTALRKEKTARPALRLHGHRAASAVPRPTSQAEVVRGVTAGKQQQLQDDVFPPPAAQLSANPASLVNTEDVGEYSKFRPTSALERPTTAAIATTAVPVSRPDFRRPLSAMMFSTHQTTVGSSSGGNAQAPKWSRPVATSDDYGWQPSTTTNASVDRRFQHFLSTTDVTRMGVMAATSTAKQGKK